MAGPSHLKPNYGLVKWWKTFFYTYGMRTQVQSPYRTDHIGPFLRHIPTSAYKKVSENLLDVGPSFALGAFTIYWADNAFAEEMKKHRS